ncbi:SDR family NAD(P)-dependent oxidoreductase [Inmirania thermothiophila]|uniref:NADP-dependent 3-hydroxy acid dehydrogenase YdfG n=1 Tax=Inmirania thermothiophila TaxID=1750597 RepID=A0A3N1YAN3_9GAMM|nr:SDR family NAD(P)-dependent oxidoreductase [Inmirania thermothiophila]ROR34447.1 NADP-dependent 3-hydroxy acid dehydrogenase YdfG [Inmirania thermothiophila]
MATVLVTGASRGLGLEWVRQYAAEGARVHACCRRPAEAAALAELAARRPEVRVHRMDVTRADEVAAVAAELGGEPLDLLVLNAGIYLEKYGEARLGALRYDDWRLTLEVNLLGAARVLEAFRGHLEAARRAVVVAVSSHMGAIADIGQAGDTYYRSSKAALNAAMRGFAHELAPRGIGLLLLHPGWVRTRMGGAAAPLTAAESVRAMRALVARFEPAMSGRFFRCDGEALPW